MNSRVALMSLKLLLFPWKRSWLSRVCCFGEPSVGSRPRSVRRFIPRTRLNSPISSVSDESERSEHEASCSEPDPSSSRPVAFRALFPRDTLRAPEAARNLAALLLAPGVSVGHARFGAGAVREASDCLVLTVGECSEGCLGEFERALSEEAEADIGSVFQESRTIGGPSSAEKSHSGRS